ncbi:hypothetical protein MMN74_26055 [Escherichia coli]|nr:hypothetical protein [Escherichia coli]
MSNCRVRQLQLTGFFIALLFVDDGVITVMIQPQTKRTTGHQQDNDNHAQNTVHITTNGLPRPEQQWPQYEWQKLPLLLNPDWLASPLQCLS